MYAVEMRTGKTRWRYPVGLASERECAGEIWSTLGPRKVGGLLCFGAGGEADVFGNCSATVHCVDRLSGHPVWQARAGKQIQSRPGYGPVTEQLYVGDYDSCLYAYDIHTGAQRWRSCATKILEASSAVAVLSDPHNPQVQMEVVVIGSWDGHVYGFDGKTGHKLWATQVGAGGYLGGQVGSSARLDSSMETAYVGGPEGVWALATRTGAVIWHYHTGAQMGSSPAISSDGATLYTGGEDGYLYAFAL